MTDFTDTLINIYKAGSPVFINIYQLTNNLLNKEKKIFFISLLYPSNPSRNFADSLFNVTKQWDESAKESTHWVSSFRSMLRADLHSWALFFCRGRQLRSSVYTAGSVTLIQECKRVNYYWYAQRSDLLTRASSFAAGRFHFYGGSFLV